MRRSALITLASILGVVVFAHHLAAQSGVIPPSARAAEEEATKHICATGLLLQSEEGREALQSFHAARKAGRLPRTLRPDYVVGDTAVFHVRTKVLLPIVEQEWIDQRFVLKAAGTVPELPDVGYRLWVEVDELRFGHVSETNISDIATAIGLATPTDSFHPDRGILANNIEIFGDPPNYDLDGIVDFLMTDIVEGTSGSIVAGFFDPNDINRSLANTNKSNQADILYLDSRQSGSNLSTVLRTVAHEFQHLIHAQQDPNEVLFVNEGQSEWAQLLNGYTIRDPNYLFRGRDDTNVELVLWDDEELLREYQRAGLWASYIADQFGPETAGSVTEEPRNGALGYRFVLGSTSEAPPLEDFVLDFHTANLVNDANVDSRFAYFAKEHLDVTAEPDRSWSGGEVDHMDVETVTLQPGGVVYYEWRSVKDFELRVDVATADAADVGARLILLRNGETTPEWLDLNLLDNQHLLLGSFDRIRAVLTRTDLFPGQTTVLISAEWQSSEVSVLEVQYGNDGWEKAFNIGDGLQAGYATRFEVPDNEGIVSLSRAFLPNYYRSQFPTETPQDADRDFRFVVMADDGTGNPGEELLLINVEDNRPLEMPDTQAPIQLFELDLQPYADLLSDLPETIYIGSVNKIDGGSDTNTLVLVTSSYQIENVSFIRGYGDWAPMWDIFLEGGGSLLNLVAPVRAEFTIDGRSVDVEPDPGTITSDELLGNYPNPFSSVSVLRYSIERDTNVNLSVFDMTGRRIATLVDAALPAGSHAVLLDGSDWAPGHYACILSTDTVRQTRLVTITH